MSGHLQSLIKKRLKEDLLFLDSGNQTEEKILANKNNLLSIVRFLMHDPDAVLDLLIDISCIEHLQNSQTCQWPHEINQKNLEIFYLFRSSKLGYRLSISVLLTEEEPYLPSLSSLYASANWLERELWDMFGVRAEGHPHLTRLLMYSNFSGHPMKRSYPVTKEQALVPIYKISGKTAFSKE